MTTRLHDLAIVGGGLAGGLIALAVRRARPDLDVVLVESGQALGGNHRWSWFDGDLDAAGKGLMAVFPVTSWKGGNSVRFPGYERQLKGRYNSLSSAGFDAALRRELPPQGLRLGQAATAIAEEGVTLADGSAIAARAVIDCRDGGGAECLTGGWQVFLGQTLHTDAPHGLAAPIIMDAAVDQPGAYRFVYVLPLAEDRIFIEDTYYADRPDLDAPVLRARIAAYAAARGWHGRVLDEETGVLPVVTGGDLAAQRARFAVPGVALAGARGGLAHPLTSYSLPVAVETALAVAPLAAAGDGPALARALDDLAAAHWAQTRFYRLLGRMLFGAAEPAQRWRIFARFYRLPEPLIERFYAGRSTRLDKLRILSGRPPVPVDGAVRALLGKGAALVHEGRR